MPDFTFGNWGLQGIIQIRKGLFGTPRHVKEYYLNKFDKANEKFNLLNHEKRIRHFLEKIAYIPDVELKIWFAPLSLLKASKQLPHFFELIKKVDSSNCFEKESLEKDLVSATSYEPRLSYGFADDGLKCSHWDGHMASAITHDLFCDCIMDDISSSTLDSYARGDRRPTNKEMKILESLAFTEQEKSIIYHPKNLAKAIIDRYSQYQSQVSKLVEGMETMSSHVLLKVNGTSFERHREKIKEAIRKEFPYEIKKSSISMLYKKLGEELQILKATGEYSCDLEKELTDWASDVIDNIKQGNLELLNESSQ